jgi:hydrogenase maturation protein HypF
VHSSFPYQELAVSNALQRVRVFIHGAVQGVGFRPFVYRLATGLGLTGWVSNSSQGVTIEAEGERSRIADFLHRLEGKKPPRASIHGLECWQLDPVGYQQFEIRPSQAEGEKTALVLPDIAICSDCLAEIFDPADRRYGYPFTNCTNCGPRFSIIEALPYDRANTTMRRFAMCEECREEYGDPSNRRFHAEPNACPRCGPQLELRDGRGNVLACREEALERAVEAVRRGKIVALKGLGGFHLVVDARDDEAVAALRQRKGRAEKPFAVMYPSLETVEAICEVDDLERRLLCSPESPIVLLRRRGKKPGDPGREEFSLASSVAPRNPYLGVMLPYTPLHHLFMRRVGCPVVATSGNLSEEPICTDEQEALRRLHGIADLFLVHDRPIARHVDDSIVRVMAGREMVLRRARGYAPLPVQVSGPLPALLAVGGHLKSTIAASVGHMIFLSQHIGDLETVQAYDAFQQVTVSFRDLYALRPVAIACDAHPDYVSSRFAEQDGLPVKRVQHHYAHILACMGENDLTGEVLGVSWDGTGYGLDGTVWGGEFLRVTGQTFERVAHFRTFRLPGGETAIQEPRRAALGLLFEIFGDTLFEMDEGAPLKAFPPQALRVLRGMLARGVNAPRTSSVGRIFDAVASIAGLRQETQFEGQAAMELEYALEGTQTEESYPFQFREAEVPQIIDWEPMVREILVEIRGHAPLPRVAVRFHNTMAEMIVAVARRAGQERVALSGGCFQNRYLTERTVKRLRAEGFRPYWHQRIPPNDGGIALGQILAGSRGEG